MNKIKQYIKISLMIILTTILAIHLFPVSVYAANPGGVPDGEVDYEGNYADDETHKNKKSSTSSKWFSTYGEGTGYKGQGVLVYMLTKEGEAVSGVTPKAFPCEMGVENITLNAQDKYGKYDEVTTWTVADIPWASDTGYNGRMMINSERVNTGAIKKWLLSKYGTNSRKGIAMVQSIWGKDIAQDFVDEKIVLVIEPIIAIQYAQREVFINTLTLRS